MCRSQQFLPDQLEPLDAFYAAGRFVILTSQGEVYADKAASEALQFNGATIAVANSPCTNAPCMQNSIQWPEGHSTARAEAAEASKRLNAQSKTDSRRQQLFLPSAVHPALCSSAEALCFPPSWVESMKAMTADCQSLLSCFHAFMLSCFQPTALLTVQSPE